MKNLIFALTLLFSFSGIALAGGKLSLKAIENAESGEAKYNLGLAIHQEIIKGAAYVGWLGAGLSEEKSSDTWYKAEQGVALYAGPLAFGVGLYYKYIPEPQVDELSYYASASLTLW